MSKGSHTVKTGKCHYSEETVNRMAEVLDLNALGSTLVPKMGKEIKNSPI